LRKRFPALLTALAVALLAAPGAHAAGPSPAQLTLRLPDLHGGYEVGPDEFGNICSTYALGWDGATTMLKQLDERFHPSGCMVDLFRLWAAPGESPDPTRVQSAAFTVTDPAGPAALIARARDVAALLADARPASLTRVQTQTVVGDETRLFRIEEVRTRVVTPPAFAVVWRSGSVLALVLTSREAGEQAALRLAATQQARIEAPTVVRRSDFDDVEVPLDDPGLGVEVQWLGRRLPASGRLPQLSLLEVVTPEPHLDSWSADLVYGTGFLRHELHVTLWPREPWRKLRHRRGRLRLPRCANPQRFTIPGGRAVVYGYYARPPAQCEARRPDLLLAIAFLPHTVALADVSGCADCRDAGRRYDSRAGLRAVVRALRPREPRSATPAP
jgi:hypothetical protein